MVTIGVDAHKATHTLVAVDEAGCKIAEKTVAATTDGRRSESSGASRSRTAGISSDGWKTTYCGRDKRCQEVCVLRR